MLQMWNKTELKPEETCHVTLHNPKNCKKSESEKLLTAQQIIEEYSDIFEGELGTLEGQQRLDVDPTVPPNTAPSQRVPFAIKAKLKAELERLTDIRVLMPVDEPTDWVSNLVIATKESGVLRLCLDPQQLNRALKRERYPLPVIDDVLPDLSRAKSSPKWTQEMATGMSNLMRHQAS